MNYMTTISILDLYLPLITAFSGLLLISIIMLCFYFGGLLERSNYKKTSNVQAGYKSASSLNTAKIIAIIDLLVFIVLPTLLYSIDFILVKFNLYKKAPHFYFLNKIAVYTTKYIIDKSSYLIILLLVIKLIFDLICIFSSKGLKVNLEKKIKDQEEDEFLLLKEKVLEHTVKEDKETRLFIVTPPQTRADTNFLWGLNSELTEEGKEQAKELLKEIKIEPDVIYTSCMLSAKQTALFMSEITKRETLSVFDECNLGDFEGLDKRKYKFYEEKDYPQNMPQKYHADNFTQRAQDAIREIEDILYRNKEKKIIIISHPFLINAINALVDEKIINKETASNTGFLQNGEFIEINVNCFKDNDKKFIKPPLNKKSE